MKYQELLKEMSEWRKENIISQEQLDILQHKYNPQEEVVNRFYKKFTGQKLMTIIAGIITVLGIIAWIAQLYPAFNNIVVFGALFFGVVALIFFGDYLQDKNMNVIRYLGKGIVILGCLLTTFIIFYLDVKIFNKIGLSLYGDDWTFYLLISGLVLIMIGYLIKVKEIISYSSFIFFIWFVSQAKVQSGEYINQWLGLTFPTRLVLFSLIFIFWGYIHEEGFHIKNKIISLKEYKLFSNTYFIWGILIGFIGAFGASLGKWIVNPLLPVQLYSTIFLLIGFGISIYTVYIGILKQKNKFIYLGLILFSIQLLGKINQIFSNVNNVIFYMIMVVVIILIAIAFEYTLMHKKEFRKELISKKG